MVPFSLEDHGRVTLPWWPFFFWHCRGMVLFFMVSGYRNHFFSWTILDGNRDQFFFSWRGTMGNDGRFFRGTSVEPWAVWTTKMGHIWDGATTRGRFLDMYHITYTMITVEVYNSVGNCSWKVGFLFFNYRKPCCSGTRGLWAMVNNFVFARRKRQPTVGLIKERESTGSILATARDLPALEIKYKRLRQKLSR